MTGPAADMVEKIAKPLELSPGSSSHSRARARRPAGAMTSPRAGVCRLTMEEAQPRTSGVPHVASHFQ